MLQNASSLIGQLGTVHIHDWVTKIKKIYEPSCLLFHGKGYQKAENPSTEQHEIIVCTIWCVGDKHLDLIS